MAKMTVKKTGRAAAAKQKAPVPAPAPATHPLTSLRREMDQLFDRFFDDFRMPSLTRGLFDFPALAGFGRDFPAVMPNVDVKETNKEIKISAELPGLDEKDIELVLSDGSLTIKGEKKAEKEEKDEGYYLMERRYGSFSRSFRLPDSVDPDKITADFNKGVLEVKLPKVKKAQKAAKKIDVKTKAA